MQRPIPIAWAAAWLVCLVACSQPRGVPIASAPEPEPRVQAPQRELLLAYQSNLLGEIEPCG
jgi:hypothetical protein